MSHKVNVIAEIGVNFETIDDTATTNALDLIAESKLAGANFVKFQLFNKETIAESPFKEKLKKLILTEEGVKHLKEEADKQKIGFILTPMYLEAVDLAAKYCDEYVKIRYRDHENKKLIEKALEKGKTLLISRPCPPVGPERFNIRMKTMYCLPQYPPRIEDFNLDLASVCEGFSSHFPHTVCDLAYAINTSFEECFIEKHVMANPKKHGYPIDGAVSITFNQLREFIKQLKLIEKIRRIRL